MRSFGVGSGVPSECSDGFPLFEAALIPQAWRRPPFPARRASTRLSTAPTPGLRTARCLPPTAQSMKPRWGRRWRQSSLTSAWSRCGARQRQLAVAGKTHASKESADDLQPRHVPHVYPCRELNSQASKVFLTSDFCENRYLCFLVESHQHLRSTINVNISRISTSTHLRLTADDCHPETF